MVLTLVKSTGRTNNFIYTTLYGNRIWSQLAGSRGTIPLFLERNLYDYLRETATYMQAIISL